MQDCLLVDSTKALVVDLYAVQWAVPSRKQKHKPKQTTKQTKHPQPQPNHTKQNKAQRSGIATSYESNMHDDILCVIMSMATEKEAKPRKHRTTQRGQARGW